MAEICKMKTDVQPMSIINFICFKLIVKNLKYTQLLALVWPSGGSDSYSKKKHTYFPHRI